MATKDEMTQDEADFASHWEDEGDGTAVNASKDDGAATGGNSGIDEAANAAGTKSDKPEGDGANNDAEAGAVSASGAGVSGNAGNKLEASAGADPESGAVSSGSSADGPTDEKEIQQERSWRGRLDKREKDLADREAKLKEAEAKLAKSPEAAGDALEKVAENAEAKGDQQLADKAEALADKVEDGQISPADAIARLKEDFGSDFVDMMTAVFKDIARQEADLISDKKFSDLEGRTREGFESIGNRHSYLHREKITEEFPDLDDIASSPKFQEFLATYPDGDKIAKEGSARQIIKMLKAFKASESESAENDGTQTAGKDQIDRDADASASAAAQAQPSEAAIDAAAGVRSSGARVPDAPKTAEGSYEGAWASA